MAKRFLSRIAVALTAATLSTGAFAEGIDPAVGQMAMLGINRNTAELTRVDFDTSQFKSLGIIRDASGNALTGIEASAYAPGFHNIFAFWTNPNDHNNYVVYVDTITALGTVVGEPLEGGPVGGAAALCTEADPCTVYAVQHAEVSPPVSISGLININPSNSENNEFVLTLPDGTEITRDQLHENTEVESGGDFYEGDAIRLHVRPKGNGNQNGLVVDGEAFRLMNSNTYVFEGQMTVRLYNDEITDNQPMGHWWIEINSGMVTMDNEVLTPQRLVKIDHRTGIVTELMTTTHPYNSLATQDGQIFYATYGKELWKLDPAAETETLMGIYLSRDYQAMAFAGTTLMIFDVSNDVLVPHSALTGEKIGSVASIGMNDLGTVVFTPLSQAPATSLAAYD